MRNSSSTFRMSLQAPPRQPRAAAGRAHAQDAGPCGNGGILNRAVPTYLCSPMPPRPSDMHTRRLSMSWLCRVYPGARPDAEGLCSPKKARKSGCS